MPDLKARVSFGAVAPRWHFSGASACFSFLPGGGCRIDIKVVGLPLGEEEPDPF